MTQIKKIRKNLKDFYYQNSLVHKLINRILKSGKKSLACKIVYQALLQIESKLNKNPILVLEVAISKVSPSVEVKSKRVGGAVYQVPTKVASHRAESLGLRWLVNEAKTKSKKSLSVTLATSIMEAAKGSGHAIKKKEEIHRAAEANRAFL